jgi:hypothetical protein
MLNQARRLSALTVSQSVFVRLLLLTRCFLFFSGDK